MKAKDTVISWDKIVKLTSFVSAVNSHPAKRMRELAKAQAEISFKAGYDQGFLDVNEGFGKGRYLAGIREVVEFARFLITHLDSQYGFIKKLEASLDWQAKLKEWGIETK